MPDELSIIFTIRIPEDEQPDVSAAHYRLPDDVNRYQIADFRRGISRLVREVFGDKVEILRDINTGADVKALLTGLPDDMLGARAGAR